MPKQNVDYSKNVIYKIVCNDKNITDLYVGRTTDMIRRKYSHSRSCKSKINLFVHKFIVDNGGWNNWNMTIVEEYPCENSVSATDRESYWINTLQATLNVYFPVADTTLYKKDWYYKNRERIRIQQNKHRELKKEFQTLYNIDTENIENNPEWYLNNMKSMIINIKE